MFQTFPRPALLNFLQSLSIRYVLLFAIGLCAAVILPATLVYVLNAAWLPGQSSVQLEQVTTIADVTFPRSMTHQEPNFYQ
jgi:hypothetical protein